MNNLNIADLPESTQERLRAITTTHPENLTVDEQAFLRARRDYLRPEQTSIFQGVLDGTVPAIDANKVEKEEVFTKKPTETPEGEVRQINHEDYKREVLVQMARDAGVLPEGEPTKAQLADAINKHLKNE